MHSAEKISSLDLFAEKQQVFRDHWNFSKLFRRRCHRSVVKKKRKKSRFIYKFFVRSWLNNFNYNFFKHIRGRYFIFTFYLSILFKSMIFPDDRCKNENRLLEDGRIEKSMHQMAWLPSSDRFTLSKTGWARLATLMQDITQ